nr:H-type lectin domain-containing protein [Citrobacter freundii]
MANLPETPQWEEGVYQIEVSDPVLGGPDGISNRQAKQLASRTSYLKQQVEKGDKGLADHIAAPDPHTQYAPKESPALTGTPTAPTAVKTDNSTKLATTGHVKAVVADYAPLASPGLTGKPTAPTAAQTANDTQLATTAFVKAALAALVASSPEALDTLNELAAALGNDPNFATTMTNALAGKQPLDSTLTTLSGKSVAALLNYLGFGDRLLEANGYFELPGGLLLQWGHGSVHATNATVSFKKPFNVTPFIVLPHKITADNRYVTSVNYTLTGFSLYGWNGDGTANNIDSYTYLALGI